MFRFFREIRNTALMESRFVRYVFYALGEILLVVIGILIALYVNERQQWREDRQQEQVYLQEFQRDMERNLHELERVIVKSSVILRASDSVIAYSRMDPEDISDERLMEYTGDLMGYTKHMTQQGTIEDLLGSGKLEVIQNDSIRRAVATWEADLKLMRELEVDSKISHESFIEYLTTHVPIYERLDMAYFKSELLDQMLYLNRIADRGIAIEYLNEVYSDIKPRWQKLLELVNREIRENPPK